jgi:hypothetical protein
MNHNQSVRLLQGVVAPHRAVGWFIRGELWVLGYWKDGQRIELARGHRKHTERTFYEARREYVKHHIGG